MKNFFIITAVALLLLIGSFAIVRLASAQDTEKPLPTLVQKIAQRFGLNQADVQAVFTEHRNEMLQQMQTRFEERLNQAVADGKITEAQKQKILAKHKELQQKKAESRQNWQDMTAEERQAAKDDLRQAREQFRSQLDSWANENGIDLEVLHMFLTRGMKFGHRGMMW